jgi:8-oxo-dGTP pyrophosphatase MutT (NUDIX family)
MTGRVGRWETLESSWLFRSSFLGLRRDRCRLPDGRLASDHYFLDIRDAAIVVAVIPDRQVLLAREYKHGAGDVLFTLPAGFIETGEAPEAAARRELGEETGYTAGSVEPLGTFFVTPSLSAMTTHAFLMPDAVKTAEPRTDEFEQIEVVAVPLAELAAEFRGGPRRYLRDVSSTLALGLALDRLR